MRFPPLLSICFYKHVCGGFELISVHRQDGENTVRHLCSVVILCVFWWYVCVCVSVGVQPRAVRVL
jgi:hypothetical protein